MKSKLAFVRQPDSISRKTAFSLRCLAAILLRLPPCPEVRSTPHQGGEQNQIRFPTVQQEPSCWAVFLFGGDAYAVSALQNYHRQTQPRAVCCCRSRLPKRRTAVQRVRPENEIYNKKKELVHAEIMLPSHAPPGYADRQNLWNAVEAVENQWNSQLARRIVLALPREVPKDQYLPMLKEFCNEQFVSKGMIADFAIHDKGDGNPHAHILLTLRAMDEHGKWLPKARKVYDLDENGERIQLPSGNWKCHKENTDRKSTRLNSSHP